MKIRPFAVLALGVLLMGYPATTALLAASGAVVVFNSNDSGPGSFRAAIARANTDRAVTQIQLAGRVSVIALQQTVNFTGAQSLTIHGNGAVLDGSGIALGAAFLATGGGDLAISRLTVRNAPAEGIDVEVPSSATGTIHVLLSHVEILDNHGHGVLVNDQEDPSTVDGVQPNSNGSAASVFVTVNKSRFAGNGYSVSDRDGLRVNEGGDGDLAIVVNLTVAADNAADGIEVDERGAGDVLVDVRNTTVVRNGKFDPDDLDDGFDIDEYDDGSVIGILVSSIANDNYEEGLDFNENNAGDLRVYLVNVEASGNREEGVDYEEDDDFAGGGDLVTIMSHVTTNGNGADGGDAGLKIREKGVGHLDATLLDIEASGTVIGGVRVREDAEGDLRSRIDRVAARENSGRGIDFDENAAGNLTVRASASTSLTNGDVDVRADQQAPGTGSFLVRNVTFATRGGNVPPTVVP
ncbi:MAG TPA: hypothetical protein VIY56_11710 [Vicinamibacterales bacterium]